jgi:multiple sugar transport system substrate-binding protein
MELQERGRRFIIAALALAGALLFGASCGKRQGGQPGPGGGSAKAGITIWWAQWEPAAGLQELGREYEKETGIPVTVFQIPWNSYQEKVFLELGNKETAFDIVVGDSQWIGSGATKGHYMELTDWLPKATDLSAYHPNALKYLCEYPAGSGKYFAAPCETDAVGFIYRRDWFEDPKEKAAFKELHKRELAPPETWEEFKEVAKFFHRPADKRSGCALLTGRGYDTLTMGFQQIMWVYGGSWGDPTTFQVKGKLDGAESVAALTFMKELLEYAPKGGANYGYDQCLEAFKNGSAAMSMLYFAFFPALSKEMGEKAGYFRVPTHQGRRVISLGGQGMSISRKTGAVRQDAAKKFIAWFLKTETQKKWAAKPGGFTAHKGILESAEFRQAAPFNAAFADSLNHLQDFWNVPAYGELLSEAQKYLGEALDGAKTPQAALTALAETHERIFAGEGLKK